MSVRNEIEPQDRILVRSAEAADLLSLSYSDFRDRVHAGEIPVALRSGGRDLFSVATLRKLFKKPAKSKAKGWKVGAA